MSTDSLSRVFLFGGGRNFGLSAMGDLWMLDLETAKWTFLNPESAYGGNRTIQGVPFPGKICVPPFDLTPPCVSFPGSRYHVVLHRVPQPDAAHVLLRLFGGFGVAVNQTGLGGLVDVWDVNVTNLAVPMWTFRSITGDGMDSLWTDVTAMLGPDWVPGASLFRHTWMVGRDLYVSGCLSPYRMWVFRDTGTNWEVVDTNSPSSTFERYFEQGNLFPHWKNHAETYLYVLGGEAVEFPAPFQVQMLSRFGVWTEEWTDIWFRSSVLATDVAPPQLGLRFSPATPPLPIPFFAETTGSFAHAALVVGGAGLDVVAYGDGDYALPTTWVTFMDDSGGSFMGFDRLRSTDDNEELATGECQHQADQCDFWNARAVPNAVVYVEAMGTVVLYGGDQDYYDTTDLLFADTWTLQLPMWCFNGDVKDGGECNGRGTCVDPFGPCVCDNTTAGGLECEIEKCEDLLLKTNSLSCGGHGSCLVAGGPCLCHELWGGLHCSAFKCEDGKAVTDPKVCSGHGNCSEAGGTCACEEGWSKGFACSGAATSSSAGTVVPLAVSLVIVFLCLLGLAAAFVVVVIVQRRIMQQRAQISKFQELEDFDVILSEQQAEKKSGNVAKIKISKDLFTIKYEDVVLRKELGRGGSGAVVYLARWNSTLCAFKMFRVSALDDGSLIKEFEKEVQLMSSIRHPNLLAFYGASLREPRLGILLEYCENGSLLSYLGLSSISTEIPSLPFGKRIEILVGILRGLVHLHSLKIIHRDMKLDNVLLDDVLCPKITDFGLSRFFENRDLRMTKRVGTSHYMAPEICLGAVYSEKIDVFSIGIMMYELLTDDLDPYGVIAKNQGAGGVELRVASDPAFRPKLQEPFTSPKFEWYTTLMKQSWGHSPDDRLSSSDLLSEVEGFAAALSEGETDPSVYRTHSGTADGQRPETLAVIQPGSAELRLSDAFSRIDTLASSLQVVSGDVRSLRAEFGQLKERLVGNQ